MNGLRLMLVSVLICCASGFSQERGIILCKSNGTVILAWAKNQAKEIADYLSCGQKVDLVDLEGAYWKVRLGCSNSSHGQCQSPSR